MRNLILISVFLVLMTSACSQFGPFIDRRREAGGFENGALYVGRSKPDMPAVCYNKIFTSYEKVKTMADEECVKNDTGTHATPVKETFFTCRLLIPSHYYFKCEK